ncbi:hypothetical protein [Streptomyces sp. NPDC094032]|uniref:hypothetical protein n=1 Tax=Streptomyces sp. NPDC094032 TaxID=3155308 RepID=UPI003331BF49
MSNEQLLAMLTPIQHARAEALSGKLKVAAEEITKIATYLRARATGGLSWKGVAAESFVEWTAATASATFHLATYTQLAGECLAESAQAMAQAKSGVEDLAKTSASAKTDYTSAQRALNAARHDPGAGKTEVKTATDDMNAAASAREKARVEALMKLHSLGQTYTFTGQRVNAAPRPEFPPPAGMGDAWREGDSYVQVPGRSSRTSTSSTTGTTQTRQVSTGRTETTTDRGVVHSTVGGTTDTGGTVRPTPTHVVPEVPADLGIDSVTTPPDTRPAPTTPPGPGAMKPEVPTYPGGTQVTPPPFMPGPGGGPGQLPTGGGTVKGGVSGMRPGPFGPGGTASTRMPRETGIVGGRPVPPTTGGRSSTGIPRSTVIGNEQAYGRGGTGPHAGGGGGGGGTAAGRRLAMEQGGVVGGKAQKSGQTGSRPFTPGGTGLVRGGQAGSGAGQAAGRGAGMHGAGARTGDDREERGGERPDYLVEDEETWQRGKRPIVPPVVD